MAETLVNSLIFLELRTVQIQKFLGLIVEFSSDHLRSTSYNYEREIFYAYSNRFLIVTPALCDRKAKMSAIGV